jgi:tripartite-type tricarboxylate transporter receptor subunit TctC
MSKRAGFLFAVAVLTFVAALPLCAADFPEKEVSIIIPWAPGGATDLIFRAVAAASQQHLGQAIVIVNRAGGGGAVGYTEGAQAKPDGYTLTAAVTPLTILPHQVKTAFTYKDFEPVINVVSDPSMFLVRADAPWKTLQEFLDQARKNPGMISVGNSGAGGGVHLVALAFEKAAGVKFNHIPFSGAAPPSRRSSAGISMPCPSRRPRGSTTCARGNSGSSPCSPKSGSRCSPTSRPSRSRG